MIKRKVIIGKRSGFCFGVKRAYDLACVSAKKNKNLYILGKLVHNNDVCAELKKKGVKEIKSLDEFGSGTVIFTAHGVGPESYKKASEKGLTIVDTTCPKVMKVQRLAKVYAGKKYQVLIFGDKNHKEVRSIKEWANNKANIIQSLSELKKIKLDKKKSYCLISQTTQDVVEFEKIVSYLRRNLEDFVYFNTICPSTDERQKEVLNLAKSNDAVIIVGGHDSANSRRLFEIAKKANPKTYFIESVKQLKKTWLNDIRKAAVIAGASTPEWIIQKIKEKITK